MSLLTRLRKHWRAGIATIITGSMLAGGLSVAFAEGDPDIGDGHGHGGGGGRDGSTDVRWVYKEDFGPLNDQTVAHFIYEIEKFNRGPADATSKTPDDVIHEAVEEAKARLNSRRPGASAHARITGIGYRWGVTSKGWRNFGPLNNDGTLDNAALWRQRYSEATSGNAYYYQGQKYYTSTVWSGGQSIEAVAKSMDTRATSTTELGIIALAEGEPALSYHVDVSTTAHPGNMYLRNNEPVYDTVHTRVTKGQWSVGNRLGATVWLNYESGQGASAQPAKAVRHDFTIDHVGDTNIPEFRPSDFGWKNGSYH